MAAIHQQPTLSVRRPSPCFLQRCDPRSRFAAFIVMSIVFSRLGDGSPVRWLTVVVVPLLPWLSAMPWRDFLSPLWKLRWFFLFLFLLHGFFVPGSALLPFAHGLSRQGALAGAQQSIHLALMATLAWVLVQTSSTEDLITGVRGLFGPLERVGIPVLKWATLLSWTLECVGRLLLLADASRRQVTLEKRGQLWSDVLTLLSQRVNLFITDMMADMTQQEHHLITQGVITGLPIPPHVAYRPGWRDVLLLTTSLFFLFLPAHGLANL
ncbi:MAG: hypothetical protein HQL62_05520 [Magnetococcales bacterium]|nr:hypothetical protein [Magnetococcales bacterium]